MLTQNIDIEVPVARNVVTPLPTDWKPETTIPTPQPDRSLVLLCPLRIIRWEGEATGPVVALMLNHCGMGRVELAVSSALQLVDLLGQFSRRPFRFSLLGAGTMSADERSLSMLFAALRRGDTAHAQSLVEWLMPPSHQRDLMNAASDLVACL
ncbi:MAG: hypothetical protein KI792_03335 [Alphaproteobacteria bacterium]|nr:hypothetical protein [Alphaproteobacteria bacterium SS10]